MSVNQVITSALGDEIKRAREGLGLSQAQLAERTASRIYSKTLASYEQGTRQCTVVRLCEIASALGANAADLVARALRRAQLDAQTVRLHVDLRALVDDPHPERKRLRRWARDRLAAYPAEPVGRLDGTHIQEMALLLDTGTIDLMGHLAVFAAPGGEA